MVFSQAGNTPENKKNVYVIVQELCGKFQNETGSLVCADLLSRMNLKVDVGGDAEARTPEYYRKRSCADMVALAAQIVDDYLQKKGV